MPAAKMQNMIRLKPRFSSTRFSAWRWLLGACWAMVFFGSALAQSAASTLDLQRPKTQVQQSIWMDENQLLDFESARTQEFKPFSPLERMALGDKVVWLRLHIKQADGAAGPLFLHLLPPHLGEVTLYSPSGPGSWRQLNLGPPAQMRH